MRTPPLAVALTAVLAFSQVGCIKKMILNGTQASTRKAAAGFASVGDVEVARVASMNGVATAEGVHYLAPDNEDTLFLLLRGWAGYASAFAEYDYDVAKDGTDKLKADYDKKRVRMAYDRAVKYGSELVEKKADGFAGARKNARTLKPWLEEHFKDKEDGETLFWLGYAWISRASFFVADDPALVGELFVGIGMVERSRELDPELMDYGASTILAAYKMRSPQSPDFEEGAKELRAIMEKLKGKSLTPQYLYATRYYCAKGDRANYEKSINEIIESPDLDPDHRLTNNLTQMKARRALRMDKMMDCGFDMSAPASK